MLLLSDQLDTNMMQLLVTLPSDAEHHLHEDDEQRTQEEETTERCRLNVKTKDQFICSEEEEEKEEEKEKKKKQEGENDEEKKKEQKQEEEDISPSPDWLGAVMMSRSLTGFFFLSSTLIGSIHLFPDTFSCFQELHTLLDEETVSFSRLVTVVSELILLGLRWRQEVVPGVQVHVSTPEGTRTEDESEALMTEKNHKVIIRTLQDQKQTWTPEGPGRPGSLHH
ncbi:uncharacterized protein V6R79_012730 [Siganus canaliculatus]